MSVHVIPVPDGMTVDEAWQQIRLFGKLLEGRGVGPNGEGGQWAVVDCGVDDCACARNLL